MADNTEFTQEFVDYLFSVIQLRKDPSDDEKWDRFREKLEQRREFLAAEMDALKTQAREIEMWVRQLDQQQFVCEFMRRFDRTESPIN